MRGSIFFHTAFMSLKFYVKLIRSAQCENYGNFLSHFREKYRESNGFIVYRSWFHEIFFRWEKISHFAIEIIFATCTLCVLKREIHLEISWNHFFTYFMSVDFCDTECTVWKLQKFSHPFLAKISWKLQFYWISY